ncbi:MAG: R3H domain-containing nucleic acid-binding protein [Myxococcota bacterium]
MSNHMDDAIETDSASSEEKSRGDDETTLAAPEPAEAPRRQEAPAPDDDGAEDPTIEDFEEDGRADKALDFIVEVLSKMTMDCTVDLMENAPEDPESDIRIEITGGDAERLIGKKGQTLAALQFLANRVINRPQLPRRHVIIDADGYRARRESALSTMAQKLGKQALDEGKIITFEPMSAQDRRVVHLALAKFEGVVTKSEGKGTTRRVQIIPVRE